MPSPLDYWCKKGVDIQGNAGILSAEGTPFLSPIQKSLEETESLKQAGDRMGACVKRGRLGEAWEPSPSPEATILPEAPPPRPRHNRLWETKVWANGALGQGPNRHQSPTQLTASLPPLHSSRGERTNGRERRCHLQAVPSWEQSIFLRAEPGLGGGACKGAGVSTYH